MTKQHSCHCDGASQAKVLGDTTTKLVAGGVDAALPIINKQVGMLVHAVHPVYTHEPHV